MGATSGLDDRVRLALPQVSRSQAQEIAHSLLNPARRPITAVIVSNVLDKQGVPGRMWKDLVDAGVLVPAGKAGDGARVFEVATEHVAAAGAVNAAAPATGTAGSGSSAAGTTRKSARRLRERICAMDKRIWQNKWLLNRPASMERFLPALEIVDRELRENDVIGSAGVSRRELSYRLFGSEKAIAGDKDVKAMLKGTGLDRFLRYRIDASVNLEHFVPRRHERMRILVSENLDPYRTVRAQLFEHGSRRILGQRIDGAVYAQGCALDAKMGDLLNLQESLGAKDVEFLYWGDLDRAGMAELQRLTETAREFGVRIRPFGAAYRKMIQLAQERFPVASMNEPTVQASVGNAGTDVIAGGLSEPELSYAAQVLAANRRIPQESLTAEELLARPKRGWRLPGLPKLAKPLLGLKRKQIPLQASAA